MKPVETIEYKGYEIKVHVDEDPTNPREDDNLGTMLCKHKRYNLGDVKESKEMDAEEILEYVKRKDVLSLGLYLYDHSRLYLKCSRNGNPWMGRLPQGHAEWDSGMVGFITITFDKIKKEYSKKKITKTLKEKVLTYLEQEVETYAQYLSGEVYGYTVEPFDDSCWGFYGSDFEENGLLEGARNAIDCGIAELEEKKVEEIGA